MRTFLRERPSRSRQRSRSWIRGSRPSGRAPSILCETLTPKLGRQVTPAEIGFAVDDASAAPETPEWRVDTLAALNDLGGGDLDMQRRHFLGTAAYSVAGLALPGGSWWEEMAEQGKSRRPALRSSVSAKDVADVRDLVSFFSHRDQRRGGGHGRTAVVAYLKTEISHYLSCTFPNNQIRRDMFAAAGELAYLSGWMAFDNSQHVIAQRYFTLAVKLAAEAQDRALAAHILRAMAHQAVDLGHGPQALALAEASMDRVRHAAAGPRERALLGVVHARSLAAVGQKKGATAALLLAENDLASATPGIAEPGRVFFFGEASLAHETACTLRDIGDLKGAEHEFARSVRTRKATAFTRTHAVTLGYLGAVQAKVGNIEAACATWSQSLEAMDGVHSGRALGTVVDMRRALSPFRKRGISAVTQLDSRAAEILRTVA